MAAERNTKNAAAKKNKIAAVQTYYQIGRCGKVEDKGTKTRFRNFVKAVLVESTEQITALFTQKSAKLLNN